MYAAARPRGKTFSAPVHMPSLVVQALLVKHTPVVAIAVGASSAHDSGTGTGFKPSQRTQP